MAKITSGETFQRIPNSMAAYNAKFLSTDPERILSHSTDKSQHCQTAISWAIEKILRSDDKIILLNVLQYGPGDPEIVKTEATELLSRASKTFIEAGNTVSGFLLKGEVKQSLCVELDKIRPDLVIIGTRGESDGKFGSNALYLAQHCLWPVLIAHPTPKLDILEEE
ncbi:hypothetical protein HDV04_000999 [Boothiomyces sp. JEL0838]|nr:hypothetical protein HDV04_000999 [Boothiomyces sp. JEL0838]